MKELNITTETYEYRDGFRVDIYKDTDEYETWQAWLYHEDCGIKMYLFGIDSSELNKDEFIEMLLDNIEVYIPFYERDYMR